MGGTVDTWTLEFGLHLWLIAPLVPNHYTNFILVPNQFFFFNYSVSNISLLWQLNWDHSNSF